MPKAKINGIEINYRESGEGFPLLLIHGFTGNLRNWALQAPVLTRGFRMVSFDQRGHGHSEKPTRPEDYSLELMAKDAYGLLQHLGIDGCYLIGHSMGGMVAQEMALGVKEYGGTDWGASTTGIAAPTGGTEEKPVGTVWVGLAKPKGGAQAFQYRFADIRKVNKGRFAHALMYRLWRALLEDTSQVDS